MKPRVFVVQPITRAPLDVLREVADVTVYPYMDRQITTDELVANARRSDYLFVMHETFVPAEVINTPNLKGIGTMGGDTAFIDYAAARARNLPIVTATPDGLFGYLQITADLTMALLLGLAYRVVEAHDYTRAGKFKQEQTIALLGQGCQGKTVGLIGYGRVAKVLVPRIRAFEMSIVYTKRNRLSPDQERNLGLEWVPDKDDVLKRADYVCITCNYNPSTDRLIGARELALMKPTAYLINTGRAWIVDQKALIQALRDGTIAGAGLDVYWNEPPCTHDPEAPPELYKMDNVILTPHNGDGTRDHRDEVTVSIAEGIVALIKGQQPAALANSKHNRARFGDPRFYYFGDPRVPAELYYSGDGS